MRSANSWPTIRRGKAEHAAARQGRDAGQRAKPRGRAAGQNQARADNEQLNALEARFETEIAKARTAVQPPTPEQVPSFLDRTAQPSWTKSPAFAGRDSSGTAWDETGQNRREMGQNGTNRPENRDKMGQNGTS